jgi:hypothetical protein
MTKEEELEGAVEITDLQISPESGGRVDAVSVPAAKRKGRTLTFLLRKSADVPHPNNDNAGHLDRSREAENPLPGKTDDTGNRAFEAIMAELRAIRAELAELKAADRKHANSLLKAAPKAEPPASKQPAGDDAGNVEVVHKSAVKRLGMRTSFANIIYG